MRGGAVAGGADGGVSQFPLELSHGRVGQCMVYTHAVPLFGALIMTMHKDGSPG